MSTAKEILVSVKNIGETYTTKFNEKPANLDQYKPDVQTKLVAEHKETVRNSTLKLLETQRAITEVASRETKDEMRKKKYPMLSSSISTDMSLGETQQTNAMLQFQNHFNNGNVEGLLEAINRGREFRRYDFVSTILDELDTAVPKTDSQNLIKEKVQPIAEEYWKDRGIPKLKEELDYLDFDARIVKLASSAVNRFADNLPIPTYKSGDYQTDEMLLANLELLAGE